MTKTSKVDLVGVGLNATDTVIPLSSYPSPGSKIEFREKTILPGGQVATTVIACQQWGLQTRYVGKLGDDSAAQLHRDEFARAGVETHLFTANDCPSQESLILVDRDGERTVLTRRDEALSLHPEDLEKEWIVSAGALHVDGYDTAAATLAAQWARSAGVPVIADLDEIYPGVEQLIENIDYLIVSRDFPSRLTGKPTLEGALQAMHARYGCRLAAATLGPDGVLAFDGKEFHHAAAYCVSVVDTTGAGDIFHAGFIFGLLQGWALDRQLDFACAAAALNCTASGARGGIGTKEAIMAVIDTTPRHVSNYTPQSAHPVAR
ncbi:carbohydrate kinase family protein [Edaphobacter sp. HDX4]|uniref:carbohydrate kinase family protein n=1 Tax=Edaphobacter sp. HDX4 TaxID=2794064 RepID=UPI002FE6335B